jgi:putative isomerase
MTTSTAARMADSTTRIDVRRTPFSLRGSHLCFSMVPPGWGHKGLLLRTMHGFYGGGWREAFRLALVREGAEADYAIDAEPHRCALVAEHASAEITFAAVDVARVRGRGGALQLIAIPDQGHTVLRAGERSWIVNSARNGSQWLFTPLRGELRIHHRHRIDDQKREIGVEQGRDRLVVELLPDADGTWEAAIEEFQTTPRRDGLADGFEQCADAMRRDWQGFLATMPRMAPEWEPAARLAMYTNYESIVARQKFLTRDAMLMSKNWMCQVFSWDHCFNAIAHAYGDPGLAWDQLMLLFDYQDPHGCLPDCVSEGGASWNYCKPPIHGWTVMRMAAANPALLTRARVEELYPKLAKWTEWWMKHRDHDGDGLCEYHHGNDSGWDNATAFDVGYPIAGADLAAFLATQMDALADLAGRIGRADEAASWRGQADAMIARLIAKLWDGTQFRSRKAFTGEHQTAGDCLMLHLPIVLGERLPRAQREAIAAALAPDGRFVTRYGPATESPASPLYLENGYWRGPIWGPTTVLVCDGLARAGYRDQAREIARRYCAMCREHLTFAENFDPLTGRPLCDPGYTWGSSAYLILAHEYLSETRAGG